MNYLAHLFLARKTPDSHFGNLLGDFRRGTELGSYSRDVLTGVDNHLLVDRVTDTHPLVADAKRLFHRSRRRFAPVALDVLFDHFLIKHWSRYTSHNIDDFRENSYRLLRQRLDTMPPRMQHVVKRMTKDDGLIGYAALSGVGRALYYLADRIRFANQFEHCIDDIELHYAALEDTFLRFFPDLLTQVREQDLEAGHAVFDVNVEPLNSAPLEQGGQPPV